MHFKLTNGVDLSIIKTSQFKTNQIIINFATEQTAENITARSLLADILETSTKKYPTQTDLARKEAELYGMYMGSSATRIGNLHTIKFRASFLNDRYAYTGLLHEVIELVNEMIFHPLVKDNAFDRNTFNVQKTNLASSINSLSDDKQYYASMELRKLYFDADSAMQIPSFGQVSDLDNITSNSLIGNYQDMIANDKINIVVLGDVDEDDVIEAFKQLKFASRETNKTDAFYRQTAHEIREKTEQQSLKQSKLNLAYLLPVYFQEANHYPAVVMNGILGGTSLSKLFVNVREKASLAYYANSNFNAFNGILTIQTGIEAENKELALELIKQQVTDVIAGNFEDELMQEVKDGIAHQLLSSLDSSGHSAERVLRDTIFAVESSVEEVIKKINAVQREDVIAAAELLDLQAVYFLNGEME